MKSKSYFYCGFCCGFVIVLSSYYILTRWYPYFDTLLDRHANVYSFGHFANIATIECKKNRCAHSDTEPSPKQSHGDWHSEWSATEVQL